jgi:hypothetical protein
MFNKFTVSAVVASILLTVGSAAMAAPKHAVRHHTTVQQIPANAYLSFGAVRSTRSANVPGNMKIQDIGFNESLGN